MGLNPHRTARAPTLTALVTAINFPAMTYSKEMNDVWPQIEGIYYAVVADSKTISIASSQPVMRKRVKSQAHLVDSRFDPPLNIRGEFRKRGIKSRVINLRRRAHLERIMACAREGVLLPSFRFPI